MPIICQTDTDESLERIFLEEENDRLKYLLSEARHYMFYGLDSKEVDSLIKKIDEILGDYNK